MSETSFIAPIDSEFKGAISKALSSQGKHEFALLLAMLQQDITKTLKISSEEEVEKDSRDLELESINFYPKTPLVAEEKHWLQQQHVTQAAASLDFATIRLMQSMFPTPLALQNDPAHIPEDVLANCDVFCQKRMAGEKMEELPEDGTLLYDVVSHARENPISEQPTFMTQ